MLSPVLIEGPTSAPVSLDEAKAHCRVDHAEDDALISGLIAAATAHLDGYTGILGRALVSQTWRQDFGRFCASMRLPLAPVASEPTISYWDTDLVQQDVDPSLYSLLSDARGPFISLQPGQSWPASARRPDAVSVTYVAGYGDDVPRPIRQAILLMVGHWYENREAVAAGDQRELPLAASALIAPYRRVGV